MMLIKKPVFAISPIVTLPEENTIALGGVATGSIKAMDAEMVAGIISRRGSSFSATAVPIMIGSSAAVVAVLEVNSVKKVTIRHIIKTITTG